MVPEWSTGSIVEAGRKKKMRKRGDGNKADNILQHAGLCRPIDSLCTAVEPHA